MRNKSNRRMSEKRAPREDLLDKIRRLRCRVAALEAERQQIRGSKRKRRKRSTRDGEDVFRDSEQLYRNLVKNTPGMLYRANPDWTTVLFTNTERLSGYTPKEFDEQGINWFSIIHPDDRDRVVSEAKELEAGPFQLVQEYRILGKDGGSRWVEDHKTSVFTKDGAYCGVDGLVFDITARKSMEAELFDAYAEMGSRVEERTRQLSQVIEELQTSHDDLRETQFQLVHAGRMTALGEVTTSVTHEMAQPLNVIKLVCQSMKRDLEGGRYTAEDLREDAADLIRSVDRMAELVDHMRSFSRRSLGMQRQEVDVNKVVRSALTFFHAQLESHNIALTLELDEELPTVMGDPMQLEQVVMNLVANARNALQKEDKENGKILIRTSPKEPSQSGTRCEALRIAVEDNARGVPVEIQDRIFDPFFTTGQAGKGTGLGLSISRQIVREHDGTIGLENRSEEGAVFEVILPVSHRSKHEAPY